VRQGLGGCWSGLKSRLMRGLLSMLGKTLIATSGAAVAMVVFAPAALGAPSPGGRPNVLFIVTDDQRIETLDVMPKTKRLFQDQGTYFPNAFATTPLCCPARASIFTGRYVHNHGVKLNNQGFLLDHSSTIQRRLTDAGYATGIVGKFLNDWNLSSNPPYFNKWSIFHNGPYADFQANEQGQLKTITQYATDYVAERAVRFIRETERQDERPWFLYVAPTAPHGPFTPEEQYATATVPQFVANPAFFESDRSDKPGYVQSTVINRTGVLNTRIAQLRMLMSVDDLVSRLFYNLRAKREENTIAFFLSDNGFMWGEHGLMAKQYPYTHSARIPFFLRWHDRVRAGVDDARMVANIDLAPTVMDAVGMPPEPAIDGMSLLRTAPRDRILLERPARPGPPTWASVRTPFYQYIETYGDSLLTPDDQPVFREYYDLVADPWQLTNSLRDADPLNDPSPQTIEALHQQLVSDLSCSGRGAVQDRPACP
jgi:arylsulfatase A-like enzyme